MKREKQIKNYFFSSLEFDHFYMKKNYKRYNDGGNVIGLIIAGLIIEILGTWTCIITADVLWIMSIIGDSPVMMVISHSMLTLTTPLFLFEELPKIKGALIVIIFKRIMLEIQTFLQKVLQINFADMLSGY